MKCFFFNCLRSFSKVLDVVAAEEVLFVVSRVGEGRIRRGRGRIQLDDVTEKPL